MIADLKPYAEYKDSGLPWLGQVPGHWEISPLARLSRLKSVVNQPDRQLLSVYLQRGVVRFADVDEKRTNATSEDLSNYQAVDPGDFVLNNQQAWRGSVGVSSYSGIVSPAYLVLSLSDKYLTRFANILFRDQIMVSQYLICSKGVGTIQRNLYWPHLKRVSVVLPPPAEQAAIVRFLDWANGRLERAIRAKRKVIALLNEQKQAIIHRAVTRGLDPSVPLKPSGIPWLGEIPAHWEVQRLKWVLRLQRGFDLPADRRKSGNVPVYSSGGHIDYHDVALATSPGVVIGRYGSTDAVFFVMEPYWPHNTALFTTTFYNNHARWCFYLLRSIAKGAYAGKSAVPGVDRKDLFDIVVPRPPVREQRVIVEAIDEQLAAFNRSSETIAKEIDLLREYRTRLVADVVTGKLDVREAAARLPEEAPLDMVEEDAEMVDDPEALDEEVGIV